MLTIKSAIRFSIKTNILSLSNFIFTRKEFQIKRWLSLAALKISVKTTVSYLQSVQMSIQINYRKILSKDQLYSLG